jgi:hypothetical protein
MAVFPTWICSKRSGSATAYTVYQSFQGDIILFGETGFNDDQAVWRGLDIISTTAHHSSCIAAILIIESIVAADVAAMRL